MNESSIDDEDVSSELVDLTLTIDSSELEDPSRSDERPTGFLAFVVFVLGFSESPFLPILVLSAMGLF